MIPNKAMKRRYSFQKVFELVTPIRGIGITLLNLGSLIRRLKTFITELFTAIGKKREPKLPLSIGYWYLPE